MIKIILPLTCTVILFACKKEKDGLPHLPFTGEEKKWMIYQTGQQLKFKNDKGDSLVYTVTNVEHNTHTPEYKDTSFVIRAYTESYYAKLVSANDSIIFYLYKDSWMHPDKLRQTIRWYRVKSMFVRLAAIEQNAPFTSRTVNGKRYSLVTPAKPWGDAASQYPFTQFEMAYYDQQSGFIEIVDVNGVSWKRV